MVGEAMTPDEKTSTKMMKVEGKHLATNNIFKAWENAKIEGGYKRCSDSDFAAYLLSLNIEEGKK